jgi:hypothetical protein
VLDKAAELDPSLREERATLSGHVFKAMATLERHGVAPGISPEALEMPLTPLEEPEQEDPRDS